MNWKIAIRASALTLNGIHPEVAKEIASLLGDQGDALEVEVVSEILNQAERALERNF